MLRFFEFEIFGKSLLCRRTILEQPGEEKVYTRAQLLNRGSSCSRKSINPTKSPSIDSKGANHPEAERIMLLPQKDETRLDSKSNFLIPKALGKEMDALGGTAAWGGSEDNDL
jgi:hypothetical protein